MKKESFSAGEVQQMLDLSRAALRYYMRKGLLDVDKSDENGYHRFTQDNLADLRDISYLRQVLDFGINDIQDCFSASTLEDYESIFTRKKALIEAEVAQKRILLKRLTQWVDYLTTLKNSPDTFHIVEFDPFVFSPTLSPRLDNLSLLCSSFSLEDGIPRFDGYGYCFDDPGDERDERCKDIIYYFPKSKYVYGLFSSEYSMNEPELLSPALDWVKENGYRIRGPIQVDYFFRVKRGADERNFYAVTIPLEGCPIRTVPVQ